MARRKLTKKQRRRRLKLLLGTLVIVFVFILGVLFGTSSYSITSMYTNLSESISNWLDDFRRPSATQNTSLAEVHVFDVGQGSSTLYQASDGTNILIDTGRHDDSDQQIISHLDEHVGMGNEIDLLIFTHNHADHIGHSDLVFDYFQVEEVWMNGLDTTTVVYEDTLDAIADSSAEYYEPKAGETVGVGPFYIEVLHPEENDSTDDQNEESIITRITVNNLSIMTSGDASYDIEDSVIQKSNQLKSEIMIIGHHGSKGSTGRNWLKAVDPEVGIYSAGTGNSYGHPHDELIYRVEDEGVPIYGTDMNGRISFYIEENGSYEMDLEYQ